jgi:hypothetical protein
MGDNANHGRQGGAGMSRREVMELVVDGVLFAAMFAAMIMELA